VTKRKWLRESEQRAWLGWMGASRLVDLSLDQQLRRDSGMSHATYSLMAVLSKAPQRTLRMADIAMMTNSSQSRLSHAVDRVEESGWITRSRNPASNREVLATLTDAGYDIIRTAAPGHVAAVRRLVFDRLSDEQVQQLADISELILQALAEEGFKVPAAIASGRGRAPRA
jgi:DNA-binding MarR family transcriptional regulator